MDAIGMTPAKDIIEAIKKLDFSKYPHGEILKELRKIGKAGLVFKSLVPNEDEVIRVRPNKKEERFSNIKQLSYKPQECNKKYQRGSTPNKTMFYGSSTQKNIPGAHPAIGRLTAINEVIPALRDAEAEFEQKVTFSKWTVTENINLITICFDKNLQQNFLEHKYVDEQFVNFLNENPEYKNRTLEINTYLSEEFSNPEPNTDKDFLYMVSAIYTEMVSKYHFEGVVYPSVRNIGYGINFAINPLSTHKLTCYSVGEAVIVKKKNKGGECIDGQSIILQKGQEDFKFNP